MHHSQSGCIANIERLNTLMDAQGLDAVVARSGKNLTYLAGFAYPGTLARLVDLSDSERAVMVVWPRKGDPVIIVNLTAAGLAERDGWIADQVHYEGYVESPYLKLTQVLQDLGLGNGRVGLEKDFISARDWQVIEQALPALQMLDCTPMMDQVRWIKTPAEIELIKTAADLLDDVYLSVFQKLRIGDTERHAHALMVGECLERGFGWAHGILRSSSNPINYAGESDVVFAAGDVMQTDYVAYLEGYPGHQSRNVIFGEPSPEQMSQYVSIRDIYRGAIDRCRAGALVADIYDATLDSFRSADWAFGSLLIGHGVGAWWHQQEPILRRGSEHRLEAGMVLALEPHIDHWHIQDMILVRDGAPLLLSSKFDTDQPYIVP